MPGFASELCPSIRCCAAESAAEGSTATESKIRLTCPSNSCYLEETILGLLPVFFLALLNGKDLARGILVFIKWARK